MRSSAAKALSVGVVATLSAAGMAWHECVLLAAAAAVMHGVPACNVSSQVCSGCWLLWRCSP